MRVLRVGIVGLGMGSSHIPKFNQHDYAEVVALCDTDPQRLQERGTEYAIEALFTDYKSMLEQAELDIVTIATPNFLHKPFTIQALAHGAHVLCEKPMAMNAQEARDMNAAAQKAGKRIMINFAFRFDPASWCLKQQIDGGLLGDIYSGRSRWMRRDGMPGFGGWFGQKDKSGGGPLIDLGVHRLDLALWYMGYPKCQHVLAHTANHLGQARAEQAQQSYDVEDYATALLSLEGGKALHLEASWASHIEHNEDMETSLFGTKGGIRQRNLKGGYSFEGHAFTEQHGCKLDLKVHNADGPPSPMYHFVDAIVHDYPHIASGAEGLAVMEILDAIYASAGSGTPISLSV